MQREQVCPVCGKEQISGEKDQCPQCNADLTCFRVLDSLPEYESKKQGWEQRILLYALTVFILFIGGWMIYQNLRISTLLIQNKKGMEEHERSVRSLLKQVESIAIERDEEKAESAASDGIMGDKSSSVGNMNPERDEQKEEAAVPEGIIGDKSSSAGNMNPALDKDKKKDLLGHQKEPWPEYFWYETSERDTLWGISERFYKHGRYYPVLIAMNPEIHIFEIKAGQRIKIIKELQDVTRLFNEFVYKSGPFQYVWYTVMENDSLGSIGKKFYKTEDQYHLIREVNPDLRLGPGQRIKILLLN